MKETAGVADPVLINHMANCKTSGARVACAWLIAAACLPSCIPLGTETVVVGPEEPSDLVATASTETPTTLEAAAVTLMAEAAGGEPPYLFRWDQNAGPADITLADTTTNTATTDPLTSPGRYVFRVVVTDSEGFHATGFVAVEVVDAVTATAPEIAVVGEPVELSATLDPRVGDASVLWEVVRGTASLEGASSTRPRLTTTTGETVEVLLTVSLPSAADAPVAWAGAQLSASGARRPGLSHGLGIRRRVQ